MFYLSLSLLGTVRPTQSSQPPAQFKFSHLLGGWSTYLGEQSHFFLLLFTPISSSAHLTTFHSFFLLLHLGSHQLCRFSRCRRKYKVVKEKVHKDKQVQCCLPVFCQKCWQALHYLFNVGFHMARLRRVPAITWFHQMRRSTFQKFPRGSSPRCSTENIRLVYFSRKLCQAAQSGSNRTGSQAQKQHRQSSQFW